MSAAVASCPHGARAGEHCNLCGATIRADGPTPVTGPDQRDRFEAFFRASRTGKGAKKAAALLARNDVDEYVEDHTQRHWWTWQTALGLGDQP